MRTSLVTLLIFSITAATFPLWVEVTLKRWGIGWAVSLQGFVAVALMFVPLVFMRYGKTCVRTAIAYADLQPARPFTIRTRLNAAAAETGEVLDTLDGSKCTCTLPQDAREAAETLLDSATEDVVDRRADGRDRTVDLRSVRRV